MNFSRKEYVKLRLCRLNNSKRIRETTRVILDNAKDRQAMVSAIGNVIADPVNLTFPAPPTSKFDLTDYAPNTEIHAQSIDIERGKNLINVIDELSIGEKVVFISYSWDSEGHKQWVKKLADDLRKSGFGVLLDQYIPKGSVLSIFMSQGLSKAHMVLVIGTREYKRKSEGISGGAAYENLVVNADLIKDIATLQYVPVLRDGTFSESLPTALANRIGYDFSEDANYDERLAELINDLRN